MVRVCYGDFASLVSSGKGNAVIKFRIFPGRNKYWDSKCYISVIVWSGILCILSVTNSARQHTTSGNRGKWRKCLPHTVIVTKLYSITEQRNPVYGCMTRATILNQWFPPWKEMVKFYTEEKTCPRPPPSRSCPPSLPHPSLKIALTSK